MHTFVFEDLLLCRVLIIHTVELEAVELRLVLWVWDLEDCRVCAGVDRGVDRDDGIFLELRLPWRAYSSDHAHTHFVTLSQ